MNLKVYKWCAVSQCINTSLKTPNKLFVYIPHKKTVRDKWLNLARRDQSLIHEQANIPFNHIMLYLRKIRLNNLFRELGDDITSNITKRILCK